jgi:hypothetical protein
VFWLAGVPRGTHCGSSCFAMILLRSVSIQAFSQSLAKQNCRSKVARTRSPTQDKACSSARVRCQPRVGLSASSDRALNKFLPEKQQRNVVTQALPGRLGNLILGSCNARYGLTTRAVSQFRRRHEWLLPVYCDGSWDLLSRVPDTLTAAPLGHRQISAGTDCSLHRYKEVGDEHWPKN